MIKHKCISNFFKSNKYPILTFFITLSLCTFILYISSVISLEDYSSTIGFSSDKFNYNYFIDGEFYKQTYNFYANWEFLYKLKKSFVSGPVVPFIFVKLSLQNLAVLFSIYSILISLSVFFWTKIIFNYLDNKYLRFISILIIILNPYNFYFVLKPGSEIPFLFFYSIFNVSFLGIFYNFNKIVKHKTKELKVFKFHFYGTFVSVLLLFLTRPTSLQIGFCLFLFMTLLMIRNPKNFYLIRKDVFIANTFLLVLITYFSFLYYEYANIGFQWLNSNPDAIAKFDNTPNKATYFGIPEIAIKQNLKNYPFLLKQVLYILWKFSNWILGICGIRDSFSIINSETLNKNLRIDQIILRISYGLFVYLPILSGNLLYLFSNFYKNFILKKVNTLDLAFYFLTIISISVIFPNIIFYSNERYIFMVFPSLLISLFYCISNKKLSVR